MKGKILLFNALWESAQKKELILVEGGVCNWHLRKDGQITIREMIVLPEKQNTGIGTSMLNKLKEVQIANCIVVKCPASFPSNKWYERKNFRLINSESNSRGTLINTWKLDLR